MVRPLPPPPSPHLPLRGRTTSGGTLNCTGGPSAGILKHITEKIRLIMCLSKDLRPFSLFSLQFTKKN